MTSATILSLIILFFTLFLQRWLWELFIPKRGRNKAKFSIVIACKNEERNLPVLFDSLRSIKYDATYFEVIFVDDNSTDRTFELLTSFCLESPQYHAYRLGEHTGKKYALQAGIKNSLYDWIVLTDADCIVPVNWLESINNSIYKKPSMYIGYSPEIYKNSFQYFKQLAAAINYAASAYAGIPVSCSGRNLVFSKKAFFEIKGYEGLFHLASGDDKLLMQRFIANDKKISYIPYPPVYTQPVEKMSLKNQNLRRYGKFSMSSLSWQMGMSIIGMLLLFVPVELALKRNYLSFGGLIAALILYVISGCALHREKVRLSYLVYAVVYPYYLGFQMIRGMTKKWVWK